jgi:DNA-binding helix-hairpin-helix protein with protein kinase domain
MTTLYDSRGGIVMLGRKIGTGGEADVFDVQNMPGFVAKKYHKPITLPHQKKLRAMLSLSNPELQKIAAWPSNTLHEHSNAQACGLIMRKVSGKEIHYLYNPKQRKVSFPDADWKALIYAARNCAAAFDALHKINVVVGDVNQSNIIVADNMVVTLIDCDSFQINIDGVLYACEVGQAAYTPPELQNRNLSRVHRTQNHDRFGLAVLIFHLLFMGRHPFVGRYLGNGGMPEIDKLIEEHRFAFGQLAGKYQMRPPIHSLTLAEVPHTIVTLFERAFASTSVTDDLRPAAIEWFNALNTVAASMRRCSVDKSHAYGINLNKCPWCALIQGGAPNFFITPMPNAISAFNLICVWEKIDQIFSPNFVYTIPQLNDNSLPSPWPLQTSLPSKPVIQNIHPNFLPLNLPPPKFEEKTIKSTPTQNIIGITTICMGLPGAFLFVIGGVLAFAGVGNTVLISSISMLVGAFVFGVWWAILEKTRISDEIESNKPYKKEIRDRRRRQQEHLERSREDFNNQKIAAQKRYDLEMRIWETEIGPHRKEAELRREASRQAISQLENLKNEWSLTATTAVNKFFQKKAELSALKAKYCDIDLQQKNEWQQLQQRAREFQLKNYLDNSFIEAVPTIGGIVGPTLKAALISFGIETASDIEEERLEQLPKGSGFGVKRINALLEWRKEVELKFKFDARTGVPKQEKHNFESKFQQMLYPIQQLLLNGHHELENIKQSADAELVKIYAKIIKHLRYVHQVEADLKSIPKGL